MTAERGGKGRQTGEPDLLASLPAERPPASQAAPGIDPAAIEELLTGVRDLRERFAGLRESDSAERPAPVTLEALQAWGDSLVTRVAECVEPGSDRLHRRENLADGVVVCAGLRRCWRRGCFYGLWSLRTRPVQRRPCRPTDEQVASLEVLTRRLSGRRASRPAP